MSGLSFDPARCVRSVTKLSECRACIDLCPVRTLAIAENGLPSFVPRECVECGGCLGVCPTEAFSLGSFDATDFFFGFVASGRSLLSCRLGLPCITALATEHLVALALLRREPLVVDIGHCATCPYKEPLYGRIVESVEEANHLLKALESGRQIRLETVAAEDDRTEPKPEEAGRRAFLKHLSPKGAAEAKREFDALVEKSDGSRRVHEIDLLALARIRQKEIPDKRKILLTALKRTPKPSMYHTVEEGTVGFLSQKYIETDTCTNCQVCYRICPTGALSSDEKMSRIDFDAMLCLKCRACHDACEPGAIRLQPVFEVKECFEPTQRLLASFRVLRCDECGISFSSLRGERVCPRCRIEEDEALDLWGLEVDETGRPIFGSVGKKDEKG